MNVGSAREGGHGVHIYPMTCQGEGGVEIYLEPMLPAPRLCILGDMPVAHASAGLARDVCHVIVTSPNDAEAVVVATMGVGDEEALEAAARSSAGYVGLVASRKKAADLYSRFLLQFLYALQHAFARVETFAFSTQLARITEALARDSYRAALDALARSGDGWSGGTKIGASIAEFVLKWPRLIDRRTVVIVLSDGWDTGEPEVLGNVMSAIHRRAGRVVWLNPLLGSACYRPLTRGMQAAVPHVDVFATAHNLASLEALARHLAL